jgi:hypothetical protein
MVDLVVKPTIEPTRHPPKEVKAATLKRKRRPGCNRGAHDPE